MPTISKRISPKDSFLHPSTPTPPGQLSASARWAELTDAPLVRDAIEKAFAEYATRLEPDPAMPGKAAYQLLGAREALNVLLTLGEPTRPIVKGEQQGLKPV
jgi:hypothetical protein